LRQQAFAAERLLTQRQQERADKADYIISGIPLGCLRREKVRALLEAISMSLHDTGLYVQFQHSLLDRKNIQSLFPRLRMVPVLLNFPPAVVYYAQKKRF